jgi:galactitol-specific phosphotransferase system IIC component
MFLYFQSTILLMIQIMGCMFLWTVFISFLVRSLMPIFIRLICYIKDRAEQKELFKETVVGKGHFLRESEVLELLLSVPQHTSSSRV